jgi:hypothetical protein
MSLRVSFIRLAKETRIPAKKQPFCLKTLKNMTTQSLHKINFVTGVNRDQIQMFIAIVTNK